MKSGQLQIIIVMRYVEEQCFGRDPGGDELGEPAVKRAGGPRWKPLRYSMFRCGDGKRETFGVPNAFCE